MVEPPTPLSFATCMTVADAQRQPAQVTIVADSGQCAVLSERFGWVAVAHCSAVLAFVVRDTTIAISGSIRARVTQNCVATGEPLASAIDTAFSVQLVPRDQLNSDIGLAGAEIELDGDALDTIFYDQGRFALSEIIGEALALSVDPWPRGPDADRWLKQKGVKREDDVGAFGALSGLRDALATSSSDSTAKDG